MELNYKQLANDLIDHLCDATSIGETIRALISMGWDNDYLIDLGFDQEDIEQASHEEMLGL
jgi:hypothetical protein